MWPGKGNKERIAVMMTIVISIDNVHLAFCSCSFSMTATGLVVIRSSVSIHATCKYCRFFFISFHSILRSFSFILISVFLFRSSHSLSTVVCAPVHCCFAAHRATHNDTNRDRDKELSARRERSETSPRYESEDSENMIM